MEKLLKINEAAEILTLSPHTLRAWLQKREIPFYRVGRSIRFKLSDLEELVKPNDSRGR